MGSKPAEWQVQRADTGQLVAEHATIARSMWARVRGLLGRDALPDGEAMVLPRCSAIHTFGMRFPIDLVFVDRNWRIVAVKGEICPGRFVGPVPGAWTVVEMAAGTMRRLGLEAGHQLSLIKNP